MAGVKEKDYAETKVERFGTFYRFKQSDVLPKLSPVLQSYFTYSLEARTDALPAAAAGAVE
ncbi:MAG: hypothetical protein E5Y74_05885 [Mesorhizobium sp.]|nr:MAG: hypothetical protein E5Y74_05885 [Mesorhizobium sp.]